MYILMYAMVNAFANVYPNVNQFYMAGLMTAPMVVCSLWNSQPRAAHAEPLTAVELDVRAHVRVKGAHPALELEHVGVQLQRQAGTGQQVGRFGAVGGEKGAHVLIVGRHAA